MNEETCIFCKIVKGEIPCYKIYEDDKFLAFLDIHPVNIGHSLVIPKDHYINIYDTTSELMSGAIKIAKELATGLRDKLGAEGVNIHMNNEKPAGQLVPHTHIHVIPRYNNDGFTHWHGARGYNPGEAEEVVEKIHL